MQTDAAAILEDWIGPADIDPASFEVFHKRWYRFDPATDEEIRTRYGTRLRQAEAGRLSTWAETPEGCLALIILFDQFSRNLYRGTARAWENDGKALCLTRSVLALNWQASYSVPGRLMLLHPLLHSEDATAQKESVTMFEALHQDCTRDWQPLVEEHLQFARSHAAVIEQFGRFPHRNALLQRTPTPEEAAFLAKDNRSYGQGTSK